MKKRRYQVPNIIWKDKRIRPEGKYIYGYILAKGRDRLITDINVGELQQVVKIKNVGLKKHLERLAELKYLIYQEYDVGMYTITNIY